MWRAALLALCATACKGGDDKPSLGWGPHKIKEFQHGPFAVKIPAGWRDASELSNEVQRSAIPAGQRWLTEQTPPNKGGLDSIRFFDQKGASWISCAEVADQLERERKTSVETVPLTAAGNPGCKFKYMSDAAHRGVLVSVGDTLYLIDCVGDPSGTVDSACDDILLQLKLDFTPPREGQQATIEKYGEELVKARNAARSCHRGKGAKAVLAIETAADGSPPTVVVLEATTPELGECAAAAMRKAKLPATATRFNETIEW